MGCPTNERGECPFCDSNVAYLDQQHSERCPWTALEAEIKAILAERRGANP